MVTYIFNNELISRDIREALFEVSKYRNLVVHGHIEKVDKEIINRTRNLLEQILDIKKKIDTQPEDRG